MGFFTENNTFFTFFAPISHSGTTPAGRRKTAPPVGKTPFLSIGRKSTLPCKGTPRKIPLRSFFARRMKLCFFFRKIPCRKFKLIVWRLRKHRSSVQKCSAEDSKSVILPLIPRKHTAGFGKVPNCLSPYPDGKGRAERRFFVLFLPPHGKRAPVRTLKERSTIRCRRGEFKEFPSNAV